MTSIIPISEWIYMDFFDSCDNKASVTSVKSTKLCIIYIYQQQNVYILSIKSYVIELNYIHTQARIYR